MMRHSMAAHWLKIVWNRRRASGLLMLEMMLSFLVLVAVALMVVYSLDLYRQPLGFDYQDVWRVLASREEGASPLTPQQLRRTLAGLEEVVAVAGANHCAMPFSNTTCGHTLDHDDSQANGLNGGVTDGIEDVMRFELVQGRWFDRADDALSWRPALINVRLRDELFGDSDPLGRTIGGVDGPETRVVGVVAEYRKEGEMSQPRPILLYRVAWPDLPRWTYLIRVRPGTTERFEERALTLLRARAKSWAFTVEPLARSRQVDINIRLVMISVAGVVCAFLLLMVGLGLMGVLWQSVTQRTRELGLRRAVGATAGDIRAQVIGELLVLTTIAVLLATAIVAQASLFELIDTMSVRVYVGALALSLAVMYSLVVLCGLYPGWLATRMQPAQALRYE